MGSMGALNIDASDASEKSRLLSKQEQLPSAWQRSVGVLAVVLTGIIAILVVCILIPTVFVKAKPYPYPIYYIRDGSSIYLKANLLSGQDSDSGNGVTQYVRVNTTYNNYGEVKNSELLLSESFPRIHSSAFVVHRDQECFKLESRLGTWVHLDVTGELRGDYRDEKTATLFLAVMVDEPEKAGDSDAVGAEAEEGRKMKLKLCQDNIWLTIAPDAIAGYSRVDVYPVPGGLGGSSSSSSSSGDGSPAENSNSDSNSEHMNIEASAAINAGSFEVELVEPIRGVNLGGWFIPEVWMTPSFFKDDPEPVWVESLCTLVNNSRDLAEERMLHRLETWITEEDFAQIAGMGFNSVRLPIGYWNIIDDPYARYAPADYTVGRRYVDFAFDMADKYGLKILLDLHGAPGSQSGLDHSGCSWAISGGAMWTLDENVELTLRALEAMVDRYGHRDSLLGVELLNEPAQSIEEIHHWELRAFYNASYTMIRERHPSLLIVFNELYPKCFSWWTDTLLEPSYYNVAMDLHIYDWQPDKANYTVEAHIESIREWRDVFREHEDMRPLIVGEWCMSYAKNATPRQDFVDANVRVFDRTMGWFAWSWKVERGNGYDDWDVQYQHSVGGPNPMHVYDAEKTDPQVTSELDDTFAIEPNPFPNPHPTSTSTHSTSTNPTTPSLRSS